MTETDLQHLRRCIELATEALDAGDEPFGSVLAGADGAALAEDRNRIAGGDSTRHPEFELARWAAENLSPEERARADRLYHVLGTTHRVAPRARRATLAGPADPYPGGRPRDRGRGAGR